MNVDYGERPAAPPWNLFALAVLETLWDRPGFHVAPRIADTVAHRAMQTYLSLEEDELLLAVFDPTNGTAAEKGWAVTNRRICWFDLDEGETDGDRPGSRSYADLPAIVELKGRIFPWLELGQGEELRLRRARRWDLAVLARGAQTGHLEGLVSDVALDKARGSLGAVNPYPEEVRRSALTSTSFLVVARRSSPRLVVTPLLIAACVLIAVVMAGSGVAEALDGEYWRLFTSMFLHGGVIHLAFNMWCPASSVLLVERLYGSIGFALLYILSGLGGSLASAWWHPMVVGVGATGAIFGVIGGLMAFLMVHRAAIPVAVLKPLRSSTLIFVAYNLVPGFLSSRIDNAAHLGGLATGLVAGFLLSRSWPVARPNQGVVR